MAKNQTEPKANDPATKPGTTQPTEPAKEGGDPTDWKAVAEQAQADLEVAATTVEAAYSKLRDLGATVNLNEAGELVSIDDPKDTGTTDWDEAKADHIKKLAGAAPILAEELEAAGASVVIGDTVQVTWDAKPPTASIYNFPVEYQKDSASGNELPFGDGVLQIPGSAFVYRGEHVFTAESGYGIDHIAGRVAAMSKRCFDRAANAPGLNPGRNPYAPFDQHENPGFGLLPDFKKTNKLVVIVAIVAGEDS